MDIHSLQTAQSVPTTPAMPTSTRRASTCLLSSRPGSVSRTSNRTPKSGTHNVRGAYKASSPPGWRLDQKLWLALSREGGREEVVEMGREKACQRGQEGSRLDKLQEDEDGGIVCCRLKNLLDHLARKW